MQDRTRHRANFFKLVAATCAALTVFLIGVTCFVSHWSALARRPGQGAALVLARAGHSSPAAQYDYEYVGPGAGIRNVPELCALLAQSFPASAYAADPSSPGSPHHRCLRLIHAAHADPRYTFGMLVERARGQLVAFVSTVHAPAQPRHISIYNVCVRADHRGQGLTRHLLPLHLHALARAQFAARAAPVDLLFGLHVSFTTPDAVTAFALYAGLGFLRAWALCPAISAFDYARAEGDAAAVYSGTLGVWADPHAFIARAQAQAASPHTALCMVKRLRVLPGRVPVVEDESFRALGDSIHAAINKLPR